MVTKRLSPQLRWPLRRADLEDVLGLNFGRVALGWVDWDKTGRDDPLSADWHDARDVSSFGGIPLVVWIRPVTRERQATVADALRTAALPDLAQWVTMALSAPPTWQQVRRERRWRVEPHGDLRILEDHGVHIRDREILRRGGVVVAAVHRSKALFCR